MLSVAATMTLQSSLMQPASDYSGVFISCPILCTHLSEDTLCRFACLSPLYRWWTLERAVTNDAVLHCGQFTRIKIEIVLVGPRYFHKPRVDLAGQQGLLLPLNGHPCTQQTQLRPQTSSRLITRVRFLRSSQWSKATSYLKTTNFKCSMKQTCRMHFFSQCWAISLDDGYEWVFPDVANTCLNKINFVTFITEPERCSPFFYGID